MTSPAVGRVLSRLEGVCRNGTEWKALCPAHADRNPSLGVAEGDEGQVILNCRAGCDTADVLTAAQLTWADLYPPDQQSRRNGHQQPDIVATYDYTDEQGDLLFQVCRLSPKSFRQRRPDGHGGWQWSTKGVRRVLYRLPEVLRAVDAGHTIYICEGEKDCDAVVRAGAFATCNPGGVGKWRHVPDAPQVLTGAHVVIVADRDEPGRRHTAEIARSLEGRAASIRVVEPTEGKDAADHLAARHSLDELVDLELVPDPPDDTDDTHPELADDSREPTSWAAIDLTDILDGADLPRPDILTRTDGTALLYRGRTHWLMGETESGKSWLAFSATTQVLNQGGTVLWIDFEDDKRTFVNRLRALGAPCDAIATHTTYIRPEEPLQTRDGRFTGAAVDYSHHLERQWDLVIIDGVTEGMLTENLNPNDNAEIANWMRLLPRRLADRTGAAVVCLDHVTKDKDGRGRWAIGGQHKIAGITGAAYRVEVIRPFGRATGTTPVDGALAIKISKDRVGWIRAQADSSERIAVAEITSYPDGGVTINLTFPTDTAADIVLCGKIADFLKLYPGSTKQAIERDVEGRAESIRTAIQYMAEEPRCWVRIDKKGNAHQHTLTEAGQWLLDPTQGHGHEPPEEEF